MTKQNLFFNILTILTFDFPVENQTFYFAKDDIGKSHKIHKMALEKSGKEYERFRKEQKRLQREASLKEIEEDIKRLKGKG